MSRRYLESLLISTIIVLVAVIVGIILLATTHPGARGGCCRNPDYHFPFTRHPHGTIPMTSTPKNERALTDAEKTEFMERLSELIIEFGVDIEVDNQNIGYNSFGSVDICDSCGYSLFTCTVGFEQSDARGILDERDEDQ